MKIISYNVNGIRAAVTKGLYEWVEEEQPDILCLQETKAQIEQIEVDRLIDLGYYCYWKSAEKKGYSGVGILTKQKPQNISLESGMENYDKEGRIIRADYNDFSVLNVYMPSGSSKQERQDFKMIFLDDFYDYITKLKQEIPNLIICGDFNICHTEIDIHNPKQNQKTSGFLPEEREWVSKFLESGFKDSFRTIHPTLIDTYSWWSYRAASRARNKGWRIDYLMVSDSLENKIHNGSILTEIKHSDHCPVSLEIKE